MLSRLDPIVAAAVLDELPPDRRAAVLGRVGRLTDVPAGALEEVAAALVAELPSPDVETLVSVDGVSRAALILNAAGKDRSSVVLSELDESEPDLAEQVRQAMFRFDDLARLDSRNMRTLLREVPTDRLTLALKGAPDAVSRAIFSGLSSRAAELIRDDLEILASARKADVEKAAVGTDRAGMVAAGTACAARRGVMAGGTTAAATTAPGETGGTRAVPKGRVTGKSA